MANYRFSLTGGDVTAISPETWEMLNKYIALALEESGADGMVTSGFQMPDDEVLRIFDVGASGLADRVLFSDVVDGP